MTANKIASTHGARESLLSPDHSAAEIIEFCREKSGDVWFCLVNDKKQKKRLLAGEKKKEKEYLSQKWAANFFERLRTSYSGPRRGEGKMIWQLFRLYKKLWERKYLNKRRSGSCRAMWAQHRDNAKRGRIPSAEQQRFAASSRWKQLQKKDVKVKSR